ncbi:MAG TPA: tripartite tricarboxylate transporter substrate-binding protein [Kiloniellales bacterium]|nr:tripartite tricarboxylate transporter substrate-binding protein [Kiloniellales bacterium]
MKFKALGSLAAAAALTVLPISAGQAQSVADFYKGKTIELLIGYSPGGGYDTYARTIARHMSKHIPGNPTIVPKNQPGAGSLKLTNFLFNVAPKDGTTFGTIGRGIPMEPLLGGEGTQFDAKEFNWIGSANDEVSICVAWHTTGIEKFEDLYEKELVVGGTGSGADTDTFPLLIKNVLGAKIKLISGYPGGSDILLAMERGEVGGRCGWSWSSVKSRRMDWIREGKVNILLQMSLAKHPDIPEVPLVMDLAETREQKQIFRLMFARQRMGRPYVAPPGVPEERVAALRKAFMDTMKDPEFLAEAKKAKLEITPVSGEEIQTLINELYEDTPQEIVDMAAEAAETQ